MILQILLTFLIIIPGCAGMTFLSSEWDSRDVENGEIPHSRYYFVVNNTKTNGLKCISDEDFERYKNNNDYSFILPKEQEKNNITNNPSEFCSYRLIEKTNDYYLYEVDLDEDTVYTSKYKVFLNNNDIKVTYTKILSPGNMFHGGFLTIIFLVIFNIILKIIRWVIEDRKLSQKPEDF